VPGVVTGQNANVTAVAGAICLSNNIPVIHMRTRLTVSGVLKDFPKKGDSQLTVTYCSWANRNKMALFKGRGGGGGFFFFC